MGDDHRAFLDATLPYVDVVYQVARHATRAGQEPEDLVQETYLRAYAVFGSYRGENTRAWLAAICLNAARSEARRRQRRPWEVPAQALDALPAARADEAPDVADVVIAGLDAQAVSRCLAWLPEPQRLCIGVDGRGRVHRAGGGGGAGLPAGHGASPGVPWPAPAGRAAG